MDQTIPKLLRRIASEHPDVAGQYTKDAKGDFKPVLYKDYYQRALDFGAGLLSLGIKRGDHIGLISDNRQEWTQADMGIMGIGAVDVPRGSDATEMDLKYILGFTEAKTAVVEDSAQINKILELEDLPLLKTLIVFDSPPEEDYSKAGKAGITLYTFEAILEKGRAWRKENPGQVEAEVEKGTPEDLACIIFTSGTTGEPKGVMLQHRNFLTQLDELPERIILYPGERALCVLPVWHSFQRLCEYVILKAASALCYSKPIGSVLLADFQKINPQLLPAVPRVFEAVYEGVYRAMRKTGGVTLALFTAFVNIAILHSKIDRRLFRKTARFSNDHLVLSWIVLVIPWLLLFPLKKLGDVLVFRKIRAKLGNAFRGGVSGGGALPPAVDDFFWAVGVNIVEGYGLTETAPVVSVRFMDRPMFGTIGSPIRGVEVRIMGDDGNILPVGQKGEVQVRGGTVMKGYYKKPELTAQVIDKDGWFSTGDIGMKTVDGEIVLKGRKKDTIVLRGGENVEPLPIELRMNESKYISQSVVVGQDQRFLAALIVPSQEELKNYADENSIRYNDWTDLLKNAEIQKLIDGEIQSLVNAKSGFKIFERISRFTLLGKQFEVGVELSAKQEIMRYRLSEIYEKEIKAMFV